MMGTFCRSEQMMGISRELFCLSNQMMGAFTDTMLPRTYLQSLPDTFNDFFVCLFVCKIEQTRSSLDPDRSIPTDTVGFSGTLFAKFPCVTDDCVKTVFQEKPKKSLVTSTQYQPLYFIIAWVRLFPQSLIS